VGITGEATRWTAIQEDLVIRIEAKLTMDMIARRKKVT